MCQDCLDQSPEDIRALKLLGAILAETDLHERAVEIFGRAVALDDNDPDLLFNYGVALRRVRHFEGAATAFRRTVALLPKFFEGWFNLGNSELDLANYSAAVAAFKTADGLTAGDIALQNNWGIALLGLGDHEAAAARFRRALEIDPNDVRSHTNLGNALLELGRLREAIDSYHEVVNREPDYGDAYYNIGNAHRSLNELEPAVIAYRTAFALDQNNRAAAVNQALTLQRLGRLNEAASVLETLVGLGRPAPRELAALATCYRDLGRFELACEKLDAALDEAPGDSSVLNSQALVEQHMGRIEEAIGTFEAGRKIDPGNEVLASNYAQALLAAGRYEQGWNAFELRRKHPDYYARADKLPGAPWQGEAAAEKTLIVDCEQGFGDAIQFVRYLPVARTRVGKLVLNCPTRLVPLLADIEGADETVSRDAPPDADLWAPLLSLPHLLSCGAPQPLSGPYIAPEPVRTTDWQERLGAGPMIGLNWLGNADYERDYARSVDVSVLAPLAEVQGVRFISLARTNAEAVPAWMEWLGNEVDAEGAFIDTAAILQSLDLVITTDTALPHLAGALARPVWMLTAFAPDWRWAGTISTTPWYRSMRLVRQPHPTDWAAPANRIADLLSGWVKTGGAPLAVFDAEANR